MDSKNMGLLILIACFVIVSAADVATTVFALNNGAHEVNPFAKPVAYDPVKLIALKIFGIGIISAFAVIVKERYKTYYPNISYFAMALVIGVTSGAVINNLFVIKNMGLI
jgi:hypothetical protein